MNNNLVIHTLLVRKKKEKGLMDLCNLHSGQSL